MSGMEWLGHRVVPVSQLACEWPVPCPWWRCLTCGERWPGLPDQRCHGAPVASDDSRHGTVNGYQNLHCRCDRCRGAWAEYVRARRNHKRVTRRVIVPQETDGDGAAPTARPLADDTVRSVDMAQGSAH